MTFAQLMELAMMTAKTAMTTAKTVASISATVGRLKEATTKNVTSIDSLVELTEENAASRDLLAAPLDALLANIEREDIEEGARTTPLVVASCTPSAVAGNLQKAPATPHDVASTQLLAVVYNIQLACAPPLVGASSLPSTVGGNLPKMDDPTHPPKPTPMSYVGTVLSEMGGDSWLALIVLSTMWGVISCHLLCLWVRYSQRWGGIVRLCRLFHRRHRLLSWLPLGSKPRRPTTANRLVIALVVAINLVLLITTTRHLPPAFYQCWGGLL